MKKSRPLARNFLTVILATASLAVFSSCDRPGGTPASGSTPAAEKGMRVKVVRATRREVVRRVSLPGTVRADLEVMLYCKVTGFLKAITKDRGDQVKQGELVAQVEIPEMTHELAHAKSSFLMEDTTLKRLEAIRQVEKSAVTDQDLDLARAKRAMADETVKRLEALLSYTQIRAPFDGTVTERFVDPGAFVQQGRIVSIVNTRTVRVLVDIPESEVRFAVVGTEAEVRLDALPGKKVRAKISRTADALDPATRTMKVELDVPNAGGPAIRPGMFAHVEIEAERRADALAVPARAVVHQQDRGFVFVVAEGVAKKVPVTLGTEDGDSFEVAQGLTGTEQIILPDGQPLADGLPVLAAEENKGPTEMTGQVTPSSSKKD